MFLQELIVYAVWTLFFFIAGIVSAVVAGQVYYHNSANASAGAAAVSLHSVTVRLFSTSDLCGKICHNVFWVPAQ